MVAALNIAGERYGRLVAIERVASRGRRTFWLFRCDCGSMAERNVEPVRAGTSRSCGCLKPEVTAARSITHGHMRGRRESREHKSWSHAKSRCFNPNDPKFQNYGGRGITMCPEWRDDFAAFFAYMGPVPIGLTLDRIDVHGNYEPGNCRWATSSEQARTRTDNVLVEHEGRILILKDYAAAIGVPYKLLHQGMRRGGLTAQASAARLLAKAA
jgi:hypothetical protein